MLHTMWCVCDDVKINGRLLYHLHHHIIFPTKSGNCSNISCQYWITIGSLMSVPDLWREEKNPCVQTDITFLVPNVLTVGNQLIFQISEGIWEPQKKYVPFSLQILSGNIMNLKPWPKTFSTHLHWKCPTLPFLIFTFIFEYSFQSHNEIIQYPTSLITILQNYHSIQPK